MGTLNNMSCMWCCMPMMWLHGRRMVVGRCRVQGIITMGRWWHHTGIRGHRGCITGWLYADVGCTSHGEIGHWGKGAVWICRSGDHWCVGLWYWLVDSTDVIGEAACKRVVVGRLSRRLGLGASLIAKLFLTTPFCSSIWKPNLWRNKIIEMLFRDSAYFGPSFGLTSYDRPQLKLYYYNCNYDLGLRSVCRAGHRKLWPNLAPFP